MTEVERRQLDEAAELAERLSTNFECWHFSDVKRSVAVEKASAALLLALRCLEANSDSDWPALNRERGELISKLTSGTQIGEGGLARLNYLNGYCDGHVAMIAPRENPANGLLEALRMAVRYVECSNHDEECGLNEGAETCTCYLTETRNKCRAAISAYESTEREGEK
jgi:hypothetical protein